MRLRFPAARLASVLLFAALCAIVAAWALQLLAPRAPIALSAAVAQARAPADLRAAGQLFGGVVPPGGRGAAAAASARVMMPASATRASTWARARRAASMLRSGRRVSGDCGSATRSAASPIDSRFGSLPK